MRPDCEDLHGELFWSCRLPMQDRKLKNGTASAHQRHQEKCQGYSVQMHSRRFHSGILKATILIRRDSRCHIARPSRSRR